MPSRPYLPIRGLFASSSDVGKVLDDLLRVLSLACTRFSTAGGKREQTSEGQRGDRPQGSKAMKGTGWASLHRTHQGQTGWGRRGLGDMETPTPPLGLADAALVVPAKPTRPLPAYFHTKSCQLILRRLNDMC